jgi:hypothetical protein
MKLLADIDFWIAIIGGALALFVFYSGGMA